MERVRLAARRARIADFIESRPLWYDEMIGDRGIRLSGGQRQRLGIARALYTEAAVIIFDEATSALDNATEVAVMESIYELSEQKTVIIIAHRLTTIQLADIIYEIGQGTVLASGTYSELIENIAELPQDDNDRGSAAQSAGDIAQRRQCFERQSVAVVRRLVLHHCRAVASRRRPNSGSSGPAMKSQTFHIDEYRNETNQFQLLFGHLRVGGGVEIFKADIDGPFATNQGFSNRSGRAHRPLYVLQQKLLHRPQPNGVVLFDRGARQHQSVQPSGGLAVDSRVPIPPEIIRLGRGIQGFRSPRSRCPDVRIVRDRE